MEKTRIDVALEEKKEQLISFVDLLTRWQKKINLIGDATLENIWQRHIVDSAQLALHIPREKKIIDLGSGAGFPGIILAILGYDVTLIESDLRKAAFLRESAHTLGLSAEVIAGRIENCRLETDGIITARACAPLVKLLHYASPLMQKNATCLFLKGKNYATELDEAQKTWDFTHEIIPSITDTSGALLAIHNVKVKHHAQ